MYEATSRSRTAPVFCMPWVPYHHWFVAYQELTLLTTRTVK